MKALDLIPAELQAMQREEEEAELRPSKVSEEDGGA